MSILSSLRTYWQALLETDELGDYQQLAVSAVASGGDARRTIICRDLIDEDSQRDATAYAGWYAYVPATGEQRAVRQIGGWTPTTGALLLNGQLDAVLPVNEEVWLIRRLGVLRQQGRPGLRDAVNAALKDLAVRDYLALVGTAGGAVDVSAYPWLTPSRILGVRRTWTAGGYPELQPGVPHLRRDGEVMLLEPPATIALGEAFSLDVARPAHTWIRHNGAWSASTVGLVDEADQAVPDVDVVTPLALWHAYLGLARGPGQDTAYWERKAAFQAEVAARIKWAEQPQAELTLDLDFDSSATEDSYSWP